MAINGTNTDESSLQKDVSDRMTAAESLNALSVEELKKRSDSLIENIGALRFAVVRIELLDGYRLLMRDLLKDCRVIIDAEGNKAMVRKIDKVLKQTEEA